MPAKITQKISITVRFWENALLPLPYANILP